MSLRIICGASWMEAVLRWVYLGSLSTCFLSSPSAASGATRRAQPPAPTPAETPTAQGADPDEVYVYDAGGRRDPFVSLLNRGSTLRPPTQRPAGLAGLSINEVSLRGIVFSRGSYLAVMQGPDDRTYILRGEERLFDAVVASITAEGVLFRQEVNDPLSALSQREVLRTLDGQEAGR